VAGSGPTCLPSPGAGPSDHASLRRACIASGSAPTPAPGDPHDDLVPTVWRLGQRLPRCRFQHHGDDPPSSDWVIDSGASSHTTPTTGTLSRSHPPHSYHPSSIVVGNGSTLPVTSVLPGPFYLNDVLVAPHITHNLLSVRRFTTDNSCSIEFDPSGFSVKDLATRTPLACCDSSGPLYTLRPSTFGATSPSALVSTTSSTTWHRRLGHPGPDVMTKIPSSLDSSCSRGHFEGLCHACQLGRHTRLPFTTSYSRAEQAFDLVHCDLWTSPVLSLSGYKYYLVILDDFSHFLWTFPLRLKSDTFTTLTHFFTWVSTQFHRPVRALQCDNGREFDNHASRSFFLTHGIQLRLSCPYTSAQNGRVERMIRTTTNMIRCLLFQASLPASYWAEALHTATHLLNCLPSKAVSHPTPYFALYDTAPTYDHLRVFGCACYPNTSATAPHKLSPRSTRCLFLGYSSDHKGYRCLDLASHRIIIPRHVVFDEDVFPLAGTSPPTDLDFLLESDPVFPSSQAPRLAPLLAPRAASTQRLAPRAAPSVTPAPRAAPPTPRAAPSTPTARFADPALVYRRRRHVTTSAPADPGPSTSQVRFADPAVVYHRRESTTPAASDVQADRPSHRCTTRSPSTATPGTSTRW
jgi:transposase InsO family protein